jgi:pimeloyl-ACP methyl ester carboxylesterase
MGEMIKAGDVGVWVERRGQGPDVLLIAGLGDPAEAWEPQLEGLANRWRLTAFDNRGAGRSPLPAAGEPFTVATMADDAAALLRALEVPPAHVMGFSGGSAIAQELALRHGELVRSLVLVSTWARSDPYLRAMAGFWRWLVEVAPSERAALEAFLLWIYTPRAHADGTVERFIAEALASPHPQSVAAFQRQLDAFMTHDTLDRLPQLRVPTLVLAGELDIPPRRALAGSWPSGSPAPGSRCCRARPTSPSRRPRPSSTTVWTASGAGCRRARHHRQHPPGDHRRQEHLRPLLRRSRPPEDRDLLAAPAAEQLRGRHPGLFAVSG